MGSFESWTALIRFSSQFAKSAMCCHAVPLEGFKFRGAGCGHWSVKCVFPFRSGDAAQVAHSDAPPRSERSGEPSGACVMEVASLGSCAKIATKEGEKLQQHLV